MDPVNVTAKFEVRSFTHSWNNSAYLKTLDSRWIRRSRSSKVVDFGTNRKRVYDFLLVHNSKLRPILHRFGDIAGFFVLPSDPTPIPPQVCGCSHCTRWPILGSARAIRPWNYFPRIPTYVITVPKRYRRTDRQMDGRHTIAIPHFECIAR